jgi:serine protease AprX
MTSSGEPDHEPISETLHRSVIAVPLLRMIETALRDGDRTPIDVVIDVNLDHPGGRAGATRTARRLVEESVTAAGTPGVAQGALRGGVGATDEQVPAYLVAGLEPAVIRDLVARDRAAPAPSERSIFRIWPDFDVRALLDRSRATVKADAARTAFAAGGRDVVWAVLDTGVDVAHPHFDEFRNTVAHGLPHRDFTGAGGETVDASGHGTHVAGVIAGHRAVRAGRDIGAVRYERDEAGEVTLRPTGLREISGVAPECGIVSYKVLGDDGVGKTSSIMNALRAVSDVNDDGRMLKIHGVNLSLGYDFDPEWFACGQSPLCVEVDRLVRSGVVVVVAAGNTGYAWATDALKKLPVAAGRTLTVNDPGNADLAITVGSTHRDMPHVYGVSYFSSKGPTGDGRAKPDLVAPGERILSAASGKIRADAEAAREGTRKEIRYAESSGTSMAAPHVSGVIAAFLSVRREFVGRPEQVKQIFTGTATDLGRVRDFQGHGLVDLMRAIQSV